MSKPFILIVEDEPLNREVLIDTLQEHGYETTVSATGGEAWQKITEYHDRLDAILLDRLLPDMDALSLLVKLKADPSMTHVPVIMQTSLSSEDEVAAGLKAGAYYYLTKPFPPATLLSIVRSAVQDHRDYLDLQQSLRQARSILKHLNHAEFWFRTQSEARDLATLIAHAAPEPERVVLGLTELMLNAVEHGNLEITYAEKTELIAANRLDAEIESRLRLPKYAGRVARLTMERTPQGIQFVIRDEGKGFDWRPYIEMSPSRAFDTHGRGIAVSRLLSFDHLEFHGRGNQVLCRILSSSR
jgi:DNA-binding response OmpR family regulator